MKTLEHSDKNIINYLTVLTQCKIAKQEDGQYITECELNLYNVLAIIEVVVKRKKVAIRS